MSAISLNANPVPIRESAPLSTAPAQDRTWTDVKIKRTWAASAAGIALTAAIVCTAFAFTATLWLLAAAIPLVLATGALVWYCSSTVDYENPEELAKVRGQALNMTLPEIIQKHGIDNLFRYSILSPKQFEKAYSSYAKTMNMRQLIGYYEAVAAKLDLLDLQHSGFHVPEPKLWKEKFRDETAHLNCNEFLSYYPNPDALLKHNIISKEEREILSEAEKANGLYSGQEEECRTEFDKRTEREREIREKTKDLALRSYYAYEDYDYALNPYRRDLNVMEQSAKVKIEFEKARFAQLSQPTNDEESKQYAQSKLRCENACADIRRRLNFDKAFLVANYERAKNSYNMNILSAREIRDRAYLLADEQYTFATKPVRDEIDAKIAKFAEEKNRKLAEINARYESFRHANRQRVSEGLEARAV